MLAKKFLKVEPYFHLYQYYFLGVLVKLKISAKHRKVPQSNLVFFYYNDIFIAQILNLHYKVHDERNTNHISYDYYPCNDKFVELTPKKSQMVLHAADLNNKLITCNTIHPIFAIFIYH